MNFLYEHRKKLNQEFLPILFLSALQIILGYSFAPYQRLGPIFSTLTWILVSIFSITMYIIAFSTAQDYAYYLNFDGYDDMPNAQFLKKLTKITMIVITSIVFFVYWRIDFFSMSNYDYLIMYAHNVLAFYLFYRAANRSPEQNIDTF